MNGSDTHAESRHGRDRWRSLDAHAALARTLTATSDTSIDAEVDIDALERWFDAQLARTSDRAFARLFADHIELPGIGESDYLHRTVEADELRVLGGIRFFGADVSRPFVEVIAWTPIDGNAGVEPWAPETIERLSGVVAREWHGFRPTRMRLHRPEAGTAGVPPPSSGWTVDVSVHLADVRAMAPDTGEVSLAPFATPSEAATLVEARFEALGRDDPALARNVTPADEATLAECHAAGSLFAMRAAGETVGLIATLPGEIDWIRGEVVTEEIVSVRHAGRGYAAAAQRALAARFARTGRARRLIGTIDGSNVASSRSALRAGRPVVSHYGFVPLER